MSKTDIHSFLTRTLFRDEIETEWTPRFRGSSLPVCPRQLMLGKFMDKPLKKKLPFVADYHMSVGHAIHDLVQKRWARQGILWGDWKCRRLECGVFAKNKIMTRCPVCNDYLLYQEKVVHDEESGFNGHCDGVVWVEELKGFVVCELKTRNSNIIKKFSNERPYESDRYQLAMYSYLIERDFWLPIAGRMIVWIGKPRPEPFLEWFYPGNGKKLYDEQVRLKMQGDKMLAEKKPLEVYGRCKEPEDVGSCPFGGICMSPKKDDLIMDMWQQWNNKI